MAKIIIVPRVTCEDIIKEEERQRKFEAKSNFLTTGQALGAVLVLGATCAIAIIFLALSMMGRLP